MRRFGLLMLLMIACVRARAQEGCPWLTEGTAATLMGGAVTASVQAANGEGTCEFVREDGSSRLRIVITHQRPRECLTGKPLTGIGEDAELCVEDIVDGHRESIQGRVRLSYFLLTMTARESKASQRNSLEQAGEEVAGNLF